MKKLLFRLLFLIILTGSCMVRTRDNNSEYLLNQQLRPIWWSDLPVKVYFDMDTMTEDQIVLSRTAFQIWNSALGEDIFEVFPPLVNDNFTDMIAQDNTIYVKLDHLRERGGIQTLGLCQYQFTYDRYGGRNGIQSIRILLHDELEWHNVIFVTLHEAGHALGLRHDRNRNSIMFKAPLGGDMEFEEKDLDFIRLQASLLRERQRH